MNPKELPKVKLEGSNKEYYYDERLQQIRNVENPHDYADLSRDENASIDYFTKQVGEGKTARLPFRLRELEYIETTEEFRPKMREKS